MGGCKWVLVKVVGVRQAVGAMVMVLWGSSEAESATKSCAV